MKSISKLEHSNLRSILVYGVNQFLEANYNTTLIELVPAYEVLLGNGFVEGFLVVTVGSKERVCVGLIKIPAFDPSSKNFSNNLGVCTWSRISGRCSMKVL